MKETPSNNLNEIWEFTPEEVQYWIGKIQTDLNSPEFRRPTNKDEEEHFENGHYLHSSQYFFAKKYFQSTDNCDKMVVLLAHKIKELNLKNTTLIGFRSYTGLLLSKAQALLAVSEFKIDYALIEQKKENDFTWQFIPDFSKVNKNLVIVLPITCTCSTYIRLRKYLESQLARLKRKFNKADTYIDTDWRVDDNFINIFLIQEEALREMPTPILVDRRKLEVAAKKANRVLSNEENKFSKLYSDYNWERIEESKIFFKVSSHNNRRRYVGHPLIKIYSKLFLPEECPLCFPPAEYLDTERNIFPTHNNFETPNLLIGFPNFGTQAIHTNSAPSKSLEKKFLFNDLFASSESLGDSHLYGHIRVNENSYLNYIRGNTFYQHNRDSILSFYNNQLESILLLERPYPIQDIVFITSESKHNSTFLDEIASNGILSSKNETGDSKFRVHILRFDASNEFVDNFMTNYKGLIRNSNSILTIYFEEVISAGKTFKLISNYLKHYKHQSDPKRDNRHGFDYIFTLIDRTPFYTREELIKKLYSTQNRSAEQNFIYFFKLNVPIVAAAHLGNPLIENVEHLKRMVLESHLDALKAKIGSELPTRVANELPEENILINKSSSLQYFPFENEQEEITSDYFESYQALLSNGKIDLLKLYVAHQINSILSDQDDTSLQFQRLKKSKEDGRLIQYVIDEICSKILTEEEMFFTQEKQPEKRNMEIEREIVHDTIIKILSRHPFTYYKDIYDSIFKYCLTQMEVQRNEIKIQNGRISFSTLRKCKFYIRKLVDLDSSYLISHDFIFLLKTLFEEEQTNRGFGVFSLRNRIDSQIKQVLEQSTNTLLIPKLNNLYYKYNQVNTFLLFLIYSFKECVFKNHYRSIKLEYLINTRTLSPTQLYSSDNSVASTLRLIRDPYYQLIGIIKAENIYLLNQLKNLHKKSYLIFLKKKIKLKAEETKLSLKERNDLYLKIENDFPFQNSKSIAKYYFDYRRNDPVIISANKFISNSRYAIENSFYHEHIKLSISEMLQTAALLMRENSPINNSQQSENEVNEYDFVNEIRTTIQSVVKILQHGIESTTMLEEGNEVPLLPGTNESKLKYALCFEYIESTHNSDFESNNVFVVSSEDADTGAKLDTRGLIYNLLYGLHSSVEKSSDEKMEFQEVVEDTDIGILTEEESQSKNKIGLQSLLVSISTGEKFTSFSDEYIPFDSSADNKPQSFDDLYRRDKKYYPFGTGLSILNSAPMSLFFRLSDLDLTSLSDGKVNLKGRAVLVVTVNDEPTKANYLTFMSNEKVRLLLLIKEELLQYLQSKFASGAFAELLKFRHEKEHKDSMGHMVKNYWLAMQHYLENPQPSKHEIDLMKFIKSKIQTHLGTRKKVVDYRKEDYPFFGETEFRNAISKLMEVPFLAHLNFKDGDYVLDIRISEPLQVHHIVFEQVFSEIIINMRRASTNLEEDEQPLFRIYKYENKIVFENKFNPRRNPNPSIPKKNGGKEMCIRILKTLKFTWEEEIFSNNMFRVTITIPN